MASLRGTERQGARGDKGSFEKVEGGEQLGLTLVKDALELVCLAVALLVEDFGEGFGVGGFGEIGQVAGVDVEVADFACGLADWLGGFECAL